MGTWHKRKVYYSGTISRNITDIILFFYNTSICKGCLNISPIGRHRKNISPNIKKDMHILHHSVIVLIKMIKQECHKYISELMPL